ncbi:D-alanine--D-alanine ligase [Oceanivirga salmonicida]|uniref:D-alanine--D-alanine ligase n=1 Tax=Oceanivirga salmonicida TaxID=1769291 RepID=UPI000832A933|nr:D-alanine--D-alanine ligase [Oceanivirga salmonicida]
MEKLKILVVMGGTSTEREISLRTGNEIYKHLDREKYNVEKLIINENKDIFKVQNMDIDFVYIALHGAFGEDGSIQAILDSMNIKYSGSGMLSSAICMDKNICKLLVKDEVTVIPGTTMRKDSLISYDEMSKKYGEKVVLKQVNGGSSLGLYIVNNKKDYDNAIIEILKLTDEIVLEKFIKGIEISVPIIAGKVYPTVRITPLKSDTFNYESKYSVDGAKEEIVEFEPKIQEKINSMTEKIYRKTKCSGFARIDYLIENNEVYMIEVNTLPGMTSASILPKSLASAGLDYSQTLDLLIESSLKK